MHQAYASLFIIQPHLLQKMTHTFNVKVSKKCAVTSSEAGTKTALTYSTLYVYNFYLFQLLYTHICALKMFRCIYA